MRKLFIPKRCHDGSLGAAPVDRHPAAAHNSEEGADGLPIGGQ